VTSKSNSATHTALAHHVPAALSVMWGNQGTALEVVIRFQTIRSNHSIYGNSYFQNANWVDSWGQATAFPPQIYDFI
jgi:hypothetical protein